MHAKCIHPSSYRHARAGVWTKQSDVLHLGSIVSLRSNVLKQSMNRRPPKMESHRRVASAVQREDTDEQVTASTRYPVIITFINHRLLRMPIENYLREQYKSNSACVHAAGHLQIEQIQS